MSRELREKADNLEKELRELLVPLSDEIKRLKNSNCNDRDSKSARF